MWGIFPKRPCRGRTAKRPSLRQVGNSSESHGRRSPPQPQARQAQREADRRQGVAWVEEHDGRYSGRRGQELFGKASPPVTLNRMERLASWLLLAFGILMAANGIASGPHAFGGGRGAVVTLVFVGLFCAIVAAWSLARRRQG